MKRTLVLNADYTPIDIIRARDAFLDVYLGKTQLVLAHEGEFFHTVDDKWPIPSITRQKSFRPHKYRKVPLTRKNIYRRDGYRCGYTGKKITNRRNLTIDHIHPLSKGGEHSWDNVVTAHKRINAEKGDYVLGEDPEVDHLKKPDVGRPHHLVLMTKGRGKIPEDWKPYLFM